ncbi:hypothetical protein ETJ91_05505 [Bacillus albus]|nr:hypothetical protein ETJ91_05505 [Bacillus albus]RXJ31694.1 hypothetical protein ETJ90_03355 [Bacillus albus]RXJ34748.1 hypothetical protein ETJ76_02540 [Bacillus albus]RXJ42917.1 hypothetical protein ETJ89_03360 [Bacillus albus]RXJ59889.1 hypothetical protein ETJ66_03355 [Bacillus albus]
MDWFRLIFCKKHKRKFHFTPFQRLVGDKARKQGEPAVGTRLVQLIFCEKHAKEVSLYYSVSKKG